PLDPTALQYRTPEREPDRFDLLEEEAERVVESPEVMLISGAEGGCIDEDSTVQNFGNTVFISANAIDDDLLSQIVVTGFPAGGDVDISALLIHPDVASASYDPVARILTIEFNPGVQ